MNTGKRRMISNTNKKIMKRICLFILCVLVCYVSNASDSAPLAIEGPVHFKVEKDSGEFYNPDTNESYFIIQHDEKLSASELFMAYRLNCVHAKVVYPYLDRTGILNAPLSWQYNNDMLVCGVRIVDEYIGIGCKYPYCYEILYYFQFKDGRVRVDAKLQKVDYKEYNKSMGKFDSNWTSLKYKEDWFNESFSIYDTQSVKQKRVESVEKAVNDYINSFISQLFHPSVTDWDNAIPWDNTINNDTLIRMAPGFKMRYSITDKDYIIIKIDGYSNHRQSRDKYCNILYTSIEPTIEKAMRISLDSRYFDYVDNYQHDDDKILALRFMPKQDIFRIPTTDFCVIFKDDMIKIYSPKIADNAYFCYKKDGMLLSGKKHEENQRFAEIINRLIVYSPFDEMWAETQPGIQEKDW